MQESIRLHFNNYVANDTVENYLRLREEIASSPDYDPYADDLEAANDLLNVGNYKEAIASLMSLMPNWFLTPFIHQLLAFAYQKLGDEPHSTMELGLSRLFLEGILATGDGSQARPYLVLRIRDEYDVLEHLEKQSQRQSLLHKNGKALDHHSCTDGTEIWFDVTMQINRLTVYFKTFAVCNLCSLRNHKSAHASLMCAK